MGSLNCNCNKQTNESTMNDEITAEAPKKILVAEKTNLDLSQEPNVNNSSISETQ
jgi:hypothetical protein